MISDEDGIQLHDRATRGGLLSLEEQFQLKEWYDHRDAEEYKLFNQTLDRKTTTFLHEQMDDVIVQLEAIRQKIQEVLSQSRSLRREMTNKRR
jgi:hypothetical protein